MIAFNGCLASDKNTSYVAFFVFQESFLKKVRAEERFNKIRREKQTAAFQFEYAAHQGQIDINWH